MARKAAKNKKRREKLKKARARNRMVQGGHGNTPEGQTEEGEDLTGDEDEQVRMSAYIVRLES